MKDYYKQLLLTVINVSVVSFSWILLVKPATAATFPSCISVSTVPCSYIDPVSGKEVWRMTNGSSWEHPDYYTSPLFSPNGKYFVYHDSNIGRSGLEIMNADGGNKRAFGNRSDQSNGAPSFGWWSPDSKYYYVTAGLYRDNAETGLSEDFVTNPSQYLPFNYPMVSPDGRVLSGIANLSDISGQGILKFINTDGTNYTSYPAPGWTAPYSGSGFDVTHGWVGNDQIWYLNDSVNDLYRNIMRVVNVHTHQYVGALDAVAPDSSTSWSGIFDHPNVSNEGYLVGGNSGMVAGYGSSANGILGGWGRANTLLVNSSNDVAAKNFTGVANSAYSQFSRPSGTDSNFSPDGKWLLTYNITGNCDVMAIYPIDKSKSPQWLATWGPGNLCDWNSGQGPYGTWSPDNTKVVFASMYDVQINRSVLRSGNNLDMYVVVVKKPDAPMSLQAVSSGNGVTLTWKSAFSHQETKEYLVERSLSQNGTWTTIAIVPEVYTYLEAPSTILSTASTINVDSTANFPSSGVIEVSGLSSERTSELIYYSGKTSTSFTGCVRGYAGTSPSKHYNDAFVWLSRTATGYTDSTSSTAYLYRVSAIEWSGLKSDPSLAAGVAEKPPPPGDFNGDGHTDILDFFQFLPFFNQSSSIYNLGNTNVIDIFDFNKLLTLIGH